MSKGSYESLKSQSDKLDSRWQREFAGKPRHTRDLGVLDGMIEKAEGVVRKAKALRGESGEALRRYAGEQLALFVKERAAIAEAKFERPEIASVHELGRAIDATTAVWRRHYAGQDRRSRDLVRLEALATELASLYERLGTIAAAHPDLVKLEGLEGIGNQLDLLRTEVKAVGEAKAALAGRDRVVNAFTEAQQGLDRYRAHFAGQPRASCDPSILEAIVTRLDASLAILDAATDDEKDGIDDFDKNHAVVREQRDLYRQELGLVKTARAAAPIRDRSGLLGGAANAVFQKYQEHFAGQNRATRDLRLLSDMCERLVDVAAQMKELSEQHDDLVARKNLEIVDERIKVYESEWIEIQKARAAAAQPAGPSNVRTAAPGETGNIRDASADGLIRIVD
jgi:hypothetical protein